MIGVFRDELRGWFCEIAGAQAMLHQHEPGYPDTGLDPTYKYLMTNRGLARTKDPNATPTPVPWWKLPMEAYAGQVDKHCHECGVPLRGYGSLAQGKQGTEQFSKTHASVCKPKKPEREVQLIETLEMIKPKALGKFTAYLQNSSK